MQFSLVDNIAIPLQLQLQAYYWKVREMPSDAMDLISHIDPSADVGR